MTDLRREARDRYCQIRLDGICTGGGEDTVLAHIRLAGITGAGLKAPDALGAWSCNACHAAVDRRSHTDLERDFVWQAFMEAVLRTQYQLIREDKIRW